MRVCAAPLRYCRRVRWNDKAIVLREPGADWSAVTAALDTAREALYELFTAVRN
jgi:uncharacterized membrane protein